ncbi:MAG: MBL fold metallo-hydrolase [Candidatus Thiodiazotropha sp. (ex Monitilora ramsayi)]|nr:MBL fold metallo-hydrolase [Candidatus Thiodiazotropha sp. (ex Monitilora ramsayi)]
MPFIAYPSAYYYPEPKKMQKRQSVEHHPWGYWVTTTSEKTNGFVKVKLRWKDKQGKEHKFAWLKEEDIQTERILEINFVDIGQGDGAFIVFPDDKRLIIDAGKGDNMYRFLRWRFNRRKTRIHYTVISHPDEDHYYGLRGLVNDPKFTFDQVYHNGIVERDGDNPLGARTPGRGSELTELCETQTQLDQVLNNPLLVGEKRYPSLLKDLRDLNPNSGITMLHHGVGHMPGFSPGEHAKGIVIECLGPAAKRVNQQLRLPWFSSTGKTKNGHSVVLRLHYGNVRVFLGGDLNIKSEHYLLEEHTRLDPTPKTLDERNFLIDVARQSFECDVMKACHHGSADVDDIFVESVNPMATVISSGDKESHCHPRPDALGIYGKYARGRRPLIFSTELARSTEEYVSMPDHIQEQITDLVMKISDDSISASETKRLQREIEKLIKRKERAVAVYGMITVRTDGDKMIMTQKLEKKRATTGEKWDIHRFETLDDGQLHYQAKH